MVRSSVDNSDMIKHYANKNKKLFIAWFSIGFFIAFFSSLNVGGYSDMLTSSITFKSLSYYYDRSGGNYAIIILFWFYVISSPFILRLHIKYSEITRKINIPGQPYTSILAVIFFIHIIFFSDQVYGGRAGDAMFAMMTMSWFSTSVLYSCVFYVLFCNASSLINHLNNRRNENGRK